MIYREANAGDRQGILEVYRSAHPDKADIFTSEWFDWFHYRSPRPSRCMVAVFELESKIVGTWTWHPVYYKLDGITSGYMASNAAVHKDYQGIRVFSGLSKYTATRFPDTISLGIYDIDSIWGTHLNWHNIGELEWFECDPIIESDRNYCITRLFRDLDRELIASFYRRIDFGIVSTYQSVNWRYERPDFDYILLQLPDRSAAAVVRRTNTACIVMDMWFEKEALTSLCTMLKRFCDKKIRFWMSRHSSYYWPFIKEGFTPTDVVQVLKSNNGRIKGLPENNYWFSLGCHDVY